MFEIYPITVKPIVKEKIWGGNFFKKIFNIKNNKKVGEIWFFADQKKESSIISNGKFKGKKLTEIYKNFSDKLLGKKLALKYKKGFPVLIKFIEAKENLSIQVHPDDRFAQKTENGYGKTEVWYILRSSKNSGILLGTKEKIKKEDISKKKFIHYLKRFKTKKYDCFFIPAGTVHTLLSGNVLLEIQQNSDITYRIYDWDRETRELHLDKAIKVIKNSKKAGPVKRISLIDQKDIKLNNLINCQYFDIYETIMEKKIKSCYNIKKPEIISIIEGKMYLYYKKEKYIFKKGDCVFFSYNTGKVDIEIIEKIRFLKIIIK